MLTELCQELRNWFVREKHFGTFTIENGELSILSDFLLENQYFRIVGSVFNDGVHKYPDDELVDETFAGSIWAMAVPPSVIALCDEIEAWQDKYGAIDGQAMSPYSSESFGGYSYSKSSGGSSSGSGSGGGVSWKSVFGDRLNRWRKIL